MTRCTLCHTPIAPTSVKRVVDGESFHAGCWDRKVRQAGEKKSAVAEANVRRPAR